MVRRNVNDDLHSDFARRRALPFQLVLYSHHSHICMKISAQKKRACVYLLLTVPKHREELFALRRVIPDIQTRHFSALVKVTNELCTVSLCPDSVNPPQQKSASSRFALPEKRSDHEAVFNVYYALKRLSKVFQCFGYECK